jgi:hypothetical protein
MCMKPIRAAGEQLRCVAYVNQVQEASHQGGERMWSEGDISIRHMVGMDRLREIHINICTPRIVMYSQGHIC